EKDLRRANAANARKRASSSITSAYTNKPIMYFFSSSALRKVPSIGEAKGDASTWIGADFSVGPWDLWQRAMQKIRDPRCHLDRWFGQLRRSCKPRSDRSTATRIPSLT